MYSHMGAQESPTCGAVPMLASLYYEMAGPSVCTYEAQPSVAAAMPPDHLHAQHRRQHPDPLVSFGDAEPLVRHGMHPMRACDMMQHAVLQCRMSACNL